MAEKIFGMASSRSQALLQVGSKRTTLTEHLIKLTLTGGQTQNYSGWLREVIGYVSHCSSPADLKAGKRLKERDFWQELFDYRSMSIKNLLVNSCEDYLPKSIKTNSDYEMIVRLLEPDLAKISKLIMPTLLVTTVVRLNETLLPSVFSNTETYKHLNSLR
jgi:hypothetical protein